MCVIVCVCVSFNFHFLLLLLLLFFFGGLTVSNAALLAHFVSSFSFLRCNSRGSLSPLFFHVSNKTRTHVHTYRHGHTDGRTEGEKCARAASFGKHTQNYFAFFIVVCYCYYYDWLLLLFTFHGMLLGVINKQRQSALHAHTLVRGGGGNYSQFFNSSEMHFLETCFFVFGDFLFFLKLILGGQFLSFFLAVSSSFFSVCIRQRGTDGEDRNRGRFTCWRSSSSSGGSRAACPVLRSYSCCSSSDCWNLR